jgi:RecA-family ATPase
MGRIAPSKGRDHPTPHYNMEAEQSVLGAILVAPDKLNPVSDLLTPEDFYQKAHGLIYKSMLDLHAKGEPVDLVTVTALLKDRGHLDRVGGLVAIGGTGKGHLIMGLGLSLATGRNIGPLEPARSFKVLYLAGEDDQEELNRRAYAATRALWPEGTPPPEIDNFIALSVMGKISPLMQLDGKRNPVIAHGYEWLCKTLINNPDVDVLIIDPKSKFFGLDENNNTDCAAWINCLESLVARFKITILFAHHESKARAGNMDQHSSRGGSAITDGCRWVSNIKTMDDNMAKRLQVDNPRDFVVMDIRSHFKTALRR